MFKFGFAVEQLLGHVTYYQNLKYWTAQDDEIEPVWMPIEANCADRWDRVPVVRSNWSLQASLRTRDAIRAVLRHQSIDALLLHTQTIALFSLDLMRSIPTVISTDATPLNYDTIGAGYQHRVGGNVLLEQQKFWWNRKSYHLATAIVAQSQWVKNSLMIDYGVAAEKIVVIPPGIDLEQWNFSAKRQASSDRVRLLFVGGDFVRKGGRILIEAFQIGLSDQCTLDIVTKDKALQQEFSGCEGICVHTDLSPGSTALQNLYAQADIFVFPTLADCNPNAIVEAMAARLPVISTDVGAIREQVEPGRNGVLVPVGDVNALVMAIRSLVNDSSKRLAMSIASRQLAQERFDGQQNYGKILTLMKQLTEKPSTNPPVLSTLNPSSL